MSYMDFSSWPREQEQTFVVYEQQSQESQKKAYFAAAIAGIGLLVLLLGIYAGVEPEHRDMTKDMNMSNLTKKVKKGDSEAPPTPKAEAPKTEAAPKTDTPAPTPAPAAAPAADPKK